MPFGSYRDLPKRSISQKTCERYGYFVGEENGKTVQVAQYRNAEGRIVGQKVRGAGKIFRTTGDFKDAVLFGQHLWRTGGRRIVITEGEVDALSLAQAMNLSWPVVSLPNGCASARKAIQKSIEFLSSYEQVVLCFDTDEPGEAAARACVDLLPPGKVAIARLPMKDANEMLVAGRVKEMVNAIWEAQVYRPDGIVTVADMRSRLSRPIEQGIPWWSERLTKLTYGRRYGECYALGAGTGVGKSDFLAEQVAYDVAELGQSVGLFMLEQQPEETLRRTAGKLADKRFWVPDGSWTQAELDASLDRLDGKVFLYDHFGATDWNTIEQRIRFLNGDGVRIFYLDHLTALAAQEEDERRALESIMASVGGLVKSLDIMLTFVSHLATPEGKPHEEGGRVMIRHFKGSRAIGFWSHFMFGLERDQSQPNTPTVFRVLKDRFSGQATGKTFNIEYSSETGRVSESDRRAEAFDHGEQSDF